MNTTKRAARIKRILFSGLLPCLLACLFLSAAHAQVATGGTYTLDQAVIANGGGTSTGTGYRVEGTAGQSAAGGNLTGLPYNVKSGFWAPSPFIPTAANVSISGRVLREDGMGIGNVRVTLIGGTLTAPRIALTSSFGYFTFEDVETGQTYVVSVSSKRYGFGQPAQAFSVVDNVTDLVFQATWQN